MTERSSDESDEMRLDLRALDAIPATVRIDAIVTEVMARIEAGRAMRSDMVARLLRVRRWTAAAAAALAVITTATVVSSPRRSSDSADAEMIARWADERHVPTNGELLATYQGYRP